MTRSEELNLLSSAYFLETKLNEIGKDCREHAARIPEPPAYPKRNNPPMLEPVLFSEPTISVPHIDVKRKSSRYVIWFVLSLIGLMMASISILFFMHPYIQIGLGMIGFGLFVSGAVVGAVKFVDESDRVRKQSAKLEADAEARIRNSHYYKQKCEEVRVKNAELIADCETRNREAAQEAEAQYQAAIQTYQTKWDIFKRVTVPNYAAETSVLTEAYNLTKSALADIYSSNVIPVPYQNLDAVQYLAAFMATSQFDLKFAIERYDTQILQKQQAEGIGLLRAQAELSSEILGEARCQSWLMEQLHEIEDHQSAAIRKIYNFDKFQFALTEYRKWKANKNK